MSYSKKLEKRGVPSKRYQRRNRDLFPHLRLFPTDPVYDQRISEIDRIIRAEEDGTAPLLKDARPDLFEEWHPDNEIQFSKAFLHSFESIRWVCLLGHTYELTVYNRTYKDRNCPSCPWWIRENSQLARELTTRNANLFRIRLEWRCTQGHIYSESVNRRLEQGLGCPHCVDELFAPFRETAERMRRSKIDHP